MSDSRDAAAASDPLKGGIGSDGRFCALAGGPGFEPGLTGPEPVVLPLNYPP